MKKIGIGIIGVGGIANSVHIPEIMESNDAQVVAICDVDKTALEKTGDKLNIPKNMRFTDYRDLIDCENVDAVEICTPNYLHIPIAVYAVEKNKPIHVEKPLSVSYEAAKPLEEMLKRKNVPNMMSFSYRFKPAVRYAKWILEKKLIGDVLSVNVEYLKSSAFMGGRRLDWRFVKEYAGTGVLGDLGVHLIDMTEFLVGKIEEVSATCGTVVKERKKLDSEEMAKVETDDYCNFLAKIKENVAGTFVITRCAVGHANTIKYDIYASKGVISFDLNNPDVLGVCIGEVDLKSNALHTVKVPKEFHYTQGQTFIDMICGKECKYLPTVEDGLNCQKVLDALLLSDTKKCWVKM